MTEQLLPSFSDVAGAETLAIMQAAPRYHAWQHQAVAPFIGTRVAELGSGTGNMSSHLSRDALELLLLTDQDEAYLSRLRRKFAATPSVRVEALSLPNDDAAAALRHYRLDTVVAFNVLEHVHQDVAALRSVSHMLEPRGRIVVLVPALPSLYGSLDTELGHVRRYTRRTLRRTIEEAGFAVQHLQYFNRIGALGWWVSARIRRQPRIPRRQLRIFDACVPVLQLERFVPLPFGQSLIGVGIFRG
jgi:SAM-dependent methyltransferase